VLNHPPDSYPQKLTKGPQKDVMAAMVLWFQQQLGELTSDYLSGVLVECMAQSS